MSRNTSWYMLPIALALGGGLLACTQAGRSIADTELSLRKGGLESEPGTPPVVYAGKDPGENTLLARGFAGAPPMIPHSIAGQEVTAKANDCLDCHDAQGSKDTPALSPTHFIKVRMKTVPREAVPSGAVTHFEGFYRVSTVSGSRYDCLLCHAPQTTDAGTGVGNSFVAMPVKNAAVDSLEALNPEGEF